MNNHAILQALTMIIILLSLASETLTAQPNNQTSTQNNPTQDYSIYSRQDTTSHHNHSIKTKYSLYQSTTPTTMENNNQHLTKETDNGLMNSSWPMYCHDTHHTGRSPYNTSQNPQGAIIWRFKNLYNTIIFGSPAIGLDSTIYIASLDLYAISPEGSLKWSYNIEGWAMTSPALDANGTIYIASAYGDHDYLYAITPTGTLKWRYYTGQDVYSSPAIGNDGTIYLGSGYNIIAVNLNGTLRWSHPTGFWVYSSPAIGDDGTIYCGSHDTYLYALYPNNGTLKWRFKTGDWVRVSPCIDTNGNIYCVSIDGYLYSLRPNGTMRWRTNVGAGNDPTIGPDGTIYAGYDHIYAINPTDGSTKWVIDAGGQIEGGTPAISHDGILYYGTWNSGNIYAINTINGAILWQTHVGDCEAALAIGPNGTIYITAEDSIGQGYLDAFGYGPLYAEANGPYQGYKNQAIQFTGTPFGGIPSYTYHWDFNDGQTSSQQNPTHTYTQAGSYNATFTITDNTGNTSTDNATVTVYYPPPVIIPLKPRRAIYAANIPLCPFLFPIIIGPITIKALVFEPAPPSAVRVDHVDFYIRGDLVKTFTHPPYRWTWIHFDQISKNCIDIYAYNTDGHYSIKRINVLRLI